MCAVSVCQFAPNWREVAKDWMGSPDEWKATAWLYSADMACAANEWLANLDSSAEAPPLAAAPALEDGEAATS